MALRTILCMVGWLVILDTANCSDDYSTEKLEDSKTDKHFFGGLFPGKCTKNGVYIRDAYSLVFCSNGNKYIQPCAPGTRNGPLHAYLPGVKYGPTDFCNVNLVPYGGAPYMYPIMHYKGLPLPVKHKNNGYLPYLFLPDQYYPSKEIPSTDGYLQPLDGNKVVETIKDTHLYEKPDALQGYHSVELNKDYHAIKQSYNLPEEPKHKYKEVEKEIHDDYIPENNNKFNDKYDNYEKIHQEYEMSDIQYELDKYDNKQNIYDKTDKKIKYKETRYEPPMMKPNKYGEIKDLPPAYKTKTYDDESYTQANHDLPKYDTGYNSPNYEDHHYEKEKYDSLVHAKHDSPTYETNKIDTQKYEAPYEENKKKYQPITDDDKEFDMFYNSYKEKSDGPVYTDDTYGEYRVGRVEKNNKQKDKHVSLKEKIHGAGYITESSKSGY